LARNLRFYSLAALSLRRYVGGRLYMLMKSRFIGDPGAPEYKQYLEIHARILAEFEDVVVEHLVAADI
jgi:hypothetical protein